MTVPRAPFRLALVTSTLDPAPEPPSPTGPRGRRAAAVIALALAALVGAGGCTRPATPPDPRPNVLLVLFDDLSADIGLYGRPARTPGLERLASRGRRFDRAYCQYPLCNPSRTSLFSGWRPERTGVWGNLRDPVPWVSGAVLLQDHFARQGYFTARVGKAYHSRFEGGFRWSEEVDTYEGAADEPEGIEWGASPEDEGRLPDVFAARSAIRILTARRSQPVFLVLGFLKPHAPWVVPERYLQLYRPDETSLPSSADATSLRTGARITIPRGRWTEAVAAYRAAVTYADAQLGVVLDALEQAHLLERTVVVVTSDNGFHAADHGIFGKATLLEPATRVPLVIAAPGVLSPGTPTRGFAELVDLYPTLLDLCELPPVPGLDGVSLRPLLEDPAGEVKDAAFSMLKVGAARSARVGRTVRTERYRYTLWPDGSEELFDHSADPDELTNLASSPAHAASHRAMQRRLQQLPPIVPAPAR